MDKNIAAILREDTKTCKVTFSGVVGNAYTYITHIPLEVGDWVVVPVGQNADLKVVEVESVDDDLNVEPNCDTKYKWVVCKIDMDAHRDNMARNREIESMLASTYRVNARQAYAQQFLAGADPKVLALVKGESK